MPRPRDDARDTARASPSVDSTASLRSFVARLSSPSSRERAAAAESLLELRIGDEGHGAAWALALCASGCVVPLLRSVQAVERDSATGAPVESADADALAASDGALLVLSELGGVANGLLENEGYQVELDESTGQPIFVDSSSGMASATTPTLRAQDELDAEERWTFALLIETLTLVTPLGVDARTGKLTWSVEVIEHVERAEDSGLEALSVIDMAVEDGSGGECTRALVRGPWRGSDGAVEAEKDPNEPLGLALDSWRDATYVAVAMASPGDGPVRRVLALGCAGGAAVASFMRTYSPETRVDVVEQDGTVVDLMVKYFGLECTRCDKKVHASDAGARGEIRVWSEDFLDFLERASGAKYDAIVGSWPQGDDETIVLRVRTLINADTGVLALSGPNGSALEALGDNAHLLRDPADVTFEDVESRPEKRTRTSATNDVRERDIVCTWFDPSKNVESFHPEHWHARLREKLGADAARFPYRIADVDTHGHFTVLDYAANDEDEDVQNLPAIDDKNSAWDAFGDEGEDAALGKAISTNVFDATYWNAILSTHGCAVSSNSDATVSEIDASATQEHVASLQENGYVWGDIIVPIKDTNALRSGIEALVDAKWPPACIFVSDVAWRVIDLLFAHAEVLLGGECVLEPSVAAFKLEKDASGKRYIGNNFGVPHRDYSLSDAVDEDGKTQVLSLWLPLNRVTETSGCMYVVSKKDDEDGGRSDVSKSAPEVPRGAAKPLAPVDAGALLAWSGNIIHWGSACQIDSPDLPRMSVAFVFRRRGRAEARADARCPPLDRAAARAADLRRRLDVIHHAIGVFEHWYGDTDEIKARLKQ